MGCVRPQPRGKFTCLIILADRERLIFQGKRRSYASRKNDWHSDKNDCSEY
jgi:hypothetical protein